MSDSFAGYLLAMMSLRRKILVKDAFLLVGLAAIIAGCVWGSLRQRQHVQASLAEVSALQQINSAQAYLLQFQQHATAGDVTSPAALAALDSASYQLRRYKAVISQYDTFLPPEITPDLRATVRSQTNQIVSNVVKLVDMVEPPSAKARGDIKDSQEVLDRVNQLARDVASLLAFCNGFVNRTDLASEQDLRIATTWVIGAAGLSLLASVAASFWQHRKIMLPLERLRQWCRRTSEHDFSMAYQPSADREFQDLARDVNQMAGDLEAFYRKLEAMVVAKSRELVRFERLASIGYLAAGVAHEINTPLNVMSGYAELSLKRIARAGDGQTIDGNLAEHLSIIRGEAFRCKEITQKLLSLTRGGGAERCAVDVSAAVADVAVMVRGLRAARDKRLTLDPSLGSSLFVWANATEVKQVLLWSRRGQWTASSS